MLRSIWYFSVKLAKIFPIKSRDCYTLRHSPVQHHAMHFVDELEQLKRNDTRN